MSSRHVYNQMVLLPGNDPRFVHYQYTVLPLNYKSMVLGPGIDPGLRGPQPRVLPLHYPSKLVRPERFELST
jgi:hypothetical protein